jgi:MFS family permease
VNFFLLFVGDAATTAIFGVIILLRIAETRPAASKDGASGSGLAARAGRVAREPLMLVFALLALLFGIVYAQSHVTLPLSMADDGLPPSDYGLAIAVNGALIVLITLRAVKVVERWPRFPALAGAALLLGTGFGMTALVDTLPLYALTVVIWTLGEIIGAAIAPVVVSEMSPVDMRGLYQGIFGSMWGLAFFIGPVLGGFVYQEFGQAALWGAAFVIGVVLAAGYLLLGVPARTRMRPAEAEPSAEPVA